MNRSKMSFSHIVRKKKVILFLEEALLNRKVKITQRCLSGYLILKIVQLFYSLPQGTVNKLKPFWSHLCLSEQCLEIHNKTPAAKGTLPGHHYRRSRSVFCTLSPAAFWTLYNCIFFLNAIYALPLIKQIGICFFFFFSDFNFSLPKK